MVMLVQPLFARGVGHRLNAVRRTIAIFHDRPDGKAADEDHYESDPLRGPTPNQQAQQYPDNSHRSGVHRERVQQNMDVFWLMKRLNEIVKQRLLHNLGVGNHANAIAADKLAFNRNCFGGVLGQLFIDWLMFADDQIHFAVAALDADR